MLAWLKSIKEIFDLGLFAIIDTIARIFTDLWSKEHPMDQKIRALDYIRARKKRHWYFPLYLIDEEHLDSEGKPSVFKYRQIYLKEIAKESFILMAVYSDYSKKQSKIDPVVITAYQIRTVLLNEKQPNHFLMRSCSFRDEKIFDMVHKLESHYLVMITTMDKINALANRVKNEQ